MVILEANKNLAFKEKKRRFKPVSWVVFLTLAIVVTNGLLDSSLLMKCKTGSGPFEVVYHRFIQRGSNTALEMHLPDMGTESIRIWISADYLQKMRLEKIIPQPETIRFTDDGIEYTFQSNADARSRIRLRVQPRESGVARARVYVPNGPELEFTQLVYP